MINDAKEINGISTSTGIDENFINHVYPKDKQCEFEDLMDFLYDGSE